MRLIPPKHHTVHGITHGLHDSEKLSRVVGTAVVESPVFDDETALATELFSAAAAIASASVPSGAVRPEDTPPASSRPDERASKPDGSVGAT